MRFPRQSDDRSAAVLPLRGGDLQMVRPRLLSALLLLALAGCHNPDSSSGVDMAIGGNPDDMAAGGGGGAGGGGSGGGGGGGSCSTGMPCTGGQICINGMCGCPAYQAFCNGQCIPVSTDPNNCGACNNACAGTKACSAGQCSATCLTGLTNCNHSCVDTNSDNQNCGGCNMPCGNGTGCVNGQCKPAAPLGPAPGKCAGGGPPISVPTGGGGSTCTGNLGQQTFTWALCSCAGIRASQTFMTDAYDSTKGPYVPGGLGGGVGLDGDWSSSQTIDVGGTLWSSTSNGLMASSPMTVRQELHVGAGVSVHQCSVSDDTYIDGNASGSTLAIGKTLYQPSGATHTGVTAAAFVPKTFTVPAPCDCSPGAIIPVAAIVAAKKTMNDNAAIGLSASLLTGGSPPQRVDLPCGEYYLTGISTSIPVTIVAHGRTALYIDGDVVSSSPVDITLDPGAELDVFIAGTLSASQTLAIGSPNYPALSRTYVGGTTTLMISSNVRLATNLYDATALVSWSAPVEVYGAVFAGDFQSSQTVKIHYDREVVQAGQGCPPAPTDGGSAGCGSCKDCNNQACVGGTCGACTDSSQCCAPLVCSNGTCVLPIQ
jgi:hypothetical protein